MKYIKQMMMAVLAILLCMHAPTRAASLYVTGNTEADLSGHGTFGVIDVSTGTYTNIQMYGAVSPTNLTWDGEKFYTVNEVGGDYLAARLNTISVTGDMSDLSALGASGPSRPLWGLAYRESNSTLYGYDYFSNEIGTVNKSTGEFTSIGSSGIVALQPRWGHLGILDDVLYAAGMRQASFNIGRFGVLSYSNGLFSQIGYSGNLFEQMLLAPGADVMYSVVYSLQPASRWLGIVSPSGVPQTLTFLSSISGADNIYFTGAAIGPDYISAIPEPHGLLLSLVAAIFLWLLANRRKNPQSTGTINFAKSMASRHLLSRCSWA